MNFIRDNRNTIIIFFLALIAFAVYYFFLKDSEFSLENSIKTIWENNVADWGYLILFLWSILEGEWGLLLAGIASHQGYLNVYMCIFVAGLGGFTGDQIYFYVGRLNKAYVQKKFDKQKRKFALANLLMRKYGWPIIFIQRYMYGLRTVIPISIGITRYSAVKFAIINLISAFIWASVTIIPAWYFGDVILDFIANVVNYIKTHNILYIVLLVIIIVIIFFYFKNRKSTLKNA